MEKRTSPIDFLVFDWFLVRAGEEETPPFFLMREGQGCLAHYLFFFYFLVGREIEMSVLSPRATFFLLFSPRDGSRWFLANATFHDLVPLFPSPFFPGKWEPRTFFFHSSQAWRTARSPPPPSFSLPRQRKAIWTKLLFFFLLGHRPGPLFPSLFPSGPGREKGDPRFLRPFFSFLLGRTMDRRLDPSFPATAAYFVPLS